MADTQPDQADQRSAGLTLNLSSNNPFRNRAISPALPSPFDDPPPRPVSRNPFLDPALTTRSSLQNLRTASESMSTLDKRTSPTAEDLFGSLTLEDKKSPPPAPPRSDGARPPPPDGARPPPPDGARPPPHARRGPPPPGRENVPPGRRGPPPNHRPTRSQEEALRARKMLASGDGAGPFDATRSPQRRTDRRPRRNSESSVMDTNRIMTEEERKQREQRRRERERRHREGKDKKPVNRKLDIIDQLDATSIYGTGMFHHDGPFDAVNPHRNKPGSRRAPMQAFPKDSLNNSLGGSGPLNKRPDHAVFMGQGDEEAFKEWSTGARTEGAEFAPKAKDVPVFDPLGRGNVLHGDESLGLGTSTFLEGTPAARTAIQKREEERAAESMNDGLQRKKSLAQRIRNINRGGRDFQASGRMTNPEGAYMSRRSPSEGGGTTSASFQAPSSERNPFFSDFDPGKKGEENFSVRRIDSNGGKVSPTSPKGFGLERRATADSAGADDSQPKGGILGRMKSLKGGRRGPPKPPSTDMGVPAPGTAV